MNFWTNFKGLLCCRWLKGPKHSKNEIYFFRSCSKEMQPIFVSYEARFSSKKKTKQKSNGPVGGHGHCWTSVSLKIVLQLQWFANYSYLVLRMTLRLVSFNFFEQKLKNIKFFFALRTPFNWKSYYLQVHSNLF